MEREFKFRYYDPSIKAMLTPACVGEFGFYAEDRDFEDGKSLPFDRLMQYVGLKDKNGKEIYEDDVVKDPGGNCLRVIWNQDACEYQLDHEDGMHSLTIECTEWAEVIGNVFQNPELINKADGKRI